MWGICRGSSFLDGCLITSRTAPNASAAGGAASDFSGNFDCMPPDALGPTTAAKLSSFGASWTGDKDRCFNLADGGAQGLALAKAQAGGGSQATKPVTLCATSGAKGSAVECTASPAMCFKAACDGKGQVSVVVAKAGGGSQQLPCPSGALGFTGYGFHLGMPLGLGIIILTHSLSYLGFFSFGELNMRGCQL